MLGTWPRLGMAWGNSVPAARRRPTRPACSSLLAGATLVAVGAVLAALLVIPRIRLSPLAFQAFNVAGYLLSLRLFATYWVRCALGTCWGRHPAALRLPAPRRLVLRAASACTAACVAEMQPRPVHPCRLLPCRWLALLGQSQIPNLPTSWPTS